ncbi:MAG TPA: GntR family transcriptional regulator [Acidobacteriaceae bacterium]|jgi:DNA-binding GntR family transcriptional regulator|nr:GntR family transcriptional regulator [Acidobacteriaceae bacterium]
MAKKRKQTPPAGSLVKSTLASRLRDEISSGALSPGVRIIEGTWGRKLGVAQGSIREAINLLAQEGFVAKISGRSARVVKLNEQDILHLYELRGALEGLAARLAAARHADVARLQEMAAAMRRASKGNRTADLVDADREFHLELCRISGNPHLMEHASRVLLPFFAFARIRIIASRQDTSAWDRDLEAHQRIADLIREGEGEIAEQYIRRAMSRFSETAYSNWEKMPLRAKRKGNRAAE